MYDIEDDADGKMAGNLNERTVSVQRSPIILSRERRNYRAVPCRVRFSSTVTLNSGIISRRVRPRNKADFLNVQNIYITYTCI